MTRKEKAIATEAATAHPIRGTAGHAVQTTLWIVVIEGTAEAVLQKGVVINTPHQTPATALLSAPLIALLDAPLTALLDAPLTALIATLLGAHLAITGRPNGTIRQPDIAIAPQTPTVIPPLRETMRSQ
ncbi:hypothetical protein ILYODFUR_010357 [Ilyodon furcidens]|uniref:Uncharacterized protein n=1 Tax=Ilyodon furcidens TaxID=33524 RepID=A0ABV0U6W5_9TELE